MRNTNIDTVQQTGYVLNLKVQDLPSSSFSINKVQDLPSSSFSIYNVQDLANSSFKILNLIDSKWRTGQV
jgi:hypothetical protein